MSLAFRPQTGNPDHLAELTKALQDHWGDVQRTEIRRAKRAGSWISLVTAEIIPEENTPRTVVQSLAEWCTEHARTEGAGMYQIVVLGQRAHAPKRRGQDPVIEENVELVKFAMRFGDDDQDAGSGGPMREIGNVVAKVAAAMDQTIAATARLFEMHQKSTDYIDQRLRQSNDLISSMMQDREAYQKINLDLFRLQAEERARQDDREDSRAEATARDERFKQAFDFAVHALRTIMAVASARAGVAPPGGSGTPQQDLAKLVTTLSETDRATIRDALGDRSWDLILAASTEQDEEKFKALCMALKREIAQLGDKGPVAMGRVAMALGDERMSLLLSIMSRAGVIDPG